MTHVQMAKDGVYPRRWGLVMQMIDSLLCPYCGQDNQVPVETSIQLQRFITDCEVCCRPFEVIAECDSGEVVSLEAVAG